MVSTRSIVRQARGLHSYNPDTRGCVLYLPFWHPGLRVSPFRSADLYRHICTVIGALWRYQGRYLDGSDDIITIPTNAAFEVTEAISIELWFNKTANSTTTSGLVSKSPFGSAYGDWDISISTADQKISFRLNPIGGTITSAAGISNATWYHLVCTYDRSNLNMYINTAAETPVAETDAIPANARDITLGQFYVAAAARRFNGVFGELRIYNRALNQAEVNYNYAKTVWRYV